MMPWEVFAALCDELRGMELSYLWRGYGSALFAEFGHLTPSTRRDGSPGVPQGAISLGIEWSWRIEHGNAIICGSDSDGDKWQPAFDRLLGARLASVGLAGAIPEIVLITTDGHRLLSFCTTEGQPQWYIVDRRSALPRWFSIRQGPASWRRLGKASVNVLGTGRANDHITYVHLWPHKRASQPC